MSLPKIPDVIFVISKPQSDSFTYFREELESFSDLIDFIMDMPDVSNALEEKMQDSIYGDGDYTKSTQSFREFVENNYEYGLDLFDYKLSKVVKG